MMTTKKIALWLAFSLLSLCAHASDYYVGVHLGAAVYDDVAKAGPAQDALTLDGLNFDSTETAFGLHLGWRARSWIALEVGYSDLGNSGIALPTGLFSAPVPASFNFNPTPALLVPPLTNLTPVFSGAVFPGPAFIGNPLLTTFARPASIEASQWHVGVKLRRQLRERLHAHWYLGLAHTRFDAGGTVSVFAAAPTPSVFPSIVQVPNADPGDETGINWGFGFDWAANDRFDVGAHWRRHNTGVLDIDTFSLVLSTNL